MKFTKENAGRNIGILLASFVSAPTSICTALLASIYGWFSNVSPNLLLLCYTLPTLLGGIVPMIMTPILGKFDKRYLVFGGLISIFVGGIIILVAGLSGFGVALLGLALVGLGQTAVQAGTNLILSDDDPVNANKACSFNFAVYNVGQILCGAIAGVLAAGGEWNRAYLVCIPAIIGALVFLFLVKKTAPTQATAAAETVDTRIAEENAPVAAPKGTTGAFVILSIIVLLVMISNAGWYTNYSVYIIDEAKIGTTVQTGLVLSIGNLGGFIGGMLFSPIFSKLFKRWSIPIFTVLICAPNLAAFLGAKSMIVFYITMFMLLGFFVPLNGEIMAASHRFKPTLVSFTTGWFAVAGFIAPYVLNFFADAMGGALKVKFGVALVCALIAIVLSIYLVKKLNAMDAEEAAAA